MNNKEITEAMEKPKMEELNDLCVKYLNDEVSLMELPNSKNLKLYNTNYYEQVIEKFLINLIKDFKEENRIIAKYIMHFVYNDEPCKPTAIPYDYLYRCINQLFNVIRAKGIPEISVEDVSKISTRLTFFKEEFYLEYIGTKTINPRKGLDYVVTEELVDAASKLIEMREEFYCSYTMLDAIETIALGKYNIEEINMQYSSRFEESNKVIVR